MGRADRRCVSGEERQPELKLRGFTYLDRTALLPELGVSIDHAGGWVLDRRTLSANALEMVLEAQVMSLPDVYAAFLSSGLELTRDSHRALAQQCMCSLYLPIRRGAASIVLVYVDIQFLEQPAQPLDILPIFSQKTVVA